MSNEKTIHQYSTYISLSFNMFFYHIEAKYMCQVKAYSFLLSRRTKYMEK